MGRVNREFGVTIVLVTHQMNVVQQVANRVAVMSVGRVVERGDVYNVFAAPQQAVTKRFIATVSGSAIGSITYEFSGDDALARDFLGGAVTFQRCHRLRHGGGPHRLRGRHRRSRIGCRRGRAAAVRGRQGGDAMSPWSHAYDIAGRQTEWTVIRNSTRR